MTRLILYGHALDVPPEAVADWAIAELVGPLEIVGLIHWAHNFSMPHSTIMDPAHSLEPVLGHLRENASTLDLPSLAPAIQEVLGSLETFVYSSHALTSWQKTQVPPTTRNAHYELVATQVPRRPPWFHKEGFQELLQALSTAFMRYLDALPSIIIMIREIAPAEADRYQLNGIEARIPAYRDVLTLGYEEAIRRGFAQ